MACGETKASSDRVSPNFEPEPRGSENSFNEGTGHDDKTIESFDRRSDPFAAPDVECDLALQDRKYLLIA